MLTKPLEMSSIFPSHEGDQRVKVVLGDTLFSFSFNFYQSLFDLQCCVSFRCTEE